MTRLLLIGDVAHYGPIGQFGNLRDMGAAMWPSETFGSRVAKLNGGNNWKAFNDFV